MKDLGSRMIAASLFIRDRIAQGATDLMVAHLGVGPFGVATGVLRLAAVMQAASMTAKTISGHLRFGSVLDISGVTSAAALRGRYRKRPAQG